MNSREHFRPVQLRRIVMVWTHHVEHFMQSMYGFEMPEGRLVWQLAQVGPTTATQLCALAYMRKFQVSRALAKLRELGLVTMARHPDDQRSEIVQLTPKGVDCSEVMLRHSLKWAALLEQDLSATELKALDSALAKMQANAEQLGPVVAGDLAAAQRRGAQAPRRAAAKAAKPPEPPQPKAGAAGTPPARRASPPTTPRRLHLR